MPRDIDAPRWHNAACGDDPDVMYPRRYTTAAIVRAAVICRRCPVRQDCLDYAIAHNERDGIWGGKTYRERKALAAQRLEAVA